MVKNRLQLTLLTMIKIMHCTLKKEDLEIINAWVFEDGSSLPPQTYQVLSLNH